MKRMVLLILALLLMMDLADDGCLGKPKIVPAPSPAKTSITSSIHLGSNHIDFWLELPSTDWRGSPRHGDILSSK
jgi:hypothetical protein